MEWIIEYWKDLDILYIKTHGVLTTNDANKMVKDAVEEMAKHQCLKQIVDHRETRFNLTVVDYYQRPNINEQIGISRKWKIAMIFKELNEDTQFMETVFRNRGYTFKRFSDLEEAKTWLLDEK